MEETLAGPANDFDDDVEELLPDADEIEVNLNARARNLAEMVDVPGAAPEA